MSIYVLSPFNYLIPNKYRNFLNLFFIDVITIFEFFALSIKLYPCFYPPFLGQKSVFQVECVVALYPENAKMRKSRIFENADDYRLFDLFLPSCIDVSHLFLCRYEVGWAFILSVDLFPHTSRGLIFTALPAFGRFSRQKWISLIFEKNEIHQFFTIFGLFQPFLRLSNTTVSTCIGRFA